MTCTRDALVLVFDRARAGDLVLNVPLELLHESSHLERAVKGRVRRHSVSVSVLVVSKTVDGVGVGLGDADRGVVDGSWKGLLVALLGREIVVRAGG